MKDIMLNILIYVGVVLFYVVSAYVVKFISAKLKEISNKTENQSAKTIIEEACSAIETAVAFTSQTFVDSLKKENAFDLDKQKAALNIAFEKSLDMMSVTAVEFLNDTYGCANDWILTKIEETVLKNK